ncbi:phage tail protein [Arenimonas terrae]|uniref:Phage tail protein n=1 Tax=Arenimonas terrae TaxID=2546226 RepID=A0A5C4RP64_9GAMM|nr:tail fiber protein [Arenimonas terrae]TNJ32878.1 phage tail protein [Arenimonas terrae]
MSNPYVGEIRLLGFNFAPVGWFPCDGRLLSIAEYEVLFVLIGTTFGGDGVTTFGLPDLRGRVPIHQGQGPGLSTYVIGQMAGTETVTLISNNIPAHSHQAFATTAAASTGTPGPTLLPGTVSGQTMYVTDTSGGAPFTLAPQSMTTAGGNQPHENCMPSLTVGFCIAWAGIFPSQN